MIARGRGRGLPNMQSLRPQMPVLKKIDD